MRDSMFILCKQNNVSVERLHICTWDIEGDKHFTEYGLEINRSNLPRLDMALSIPQLSNLKNIRCLYKNVSDPVNCRFIFNSDIDKITHINGNPEFGANVSLKKDRQIAILPLEGYLEIKDGLLMVNLEIPKQAGPIIYVRFLVKSNTPSFSHTKNGISKKTISYDVRVNECRTASTEVNTAQKKGYVIMSINKCFCFHIIPSTYNVDFVDSVKLKTIRGLEDVGFNTYLGDIKSQENIQLKANEYNIVFCKHEKSSNYSFFSIYSKEFIGNTQVSFALAANLICSLLFAFGGLRTSEKPVGQHYWELIPVEYCIAIVVLIILIIYLICRRK